MTYANLPRRRRSPSAKASRPPPAGREEPPRIGVEEPPDENHHSDDEEAEGLIAPKGSQLFDAPLFFGELFLIRLDAAFNHGGLAPA